MPLFYDFTIFLILGRNLSNISVVFWKIKKRNQKDILKVTDLKFLLVFSERTKKNRDEEPKISVELPVFEVVSALKAERMKNSEYKEFKIPVEH